MSYKALYRTYRPATFDQVAGQQHIVRTLQNAFRENKIAHAYLFCGPRGTGKTTMARLFAKGLNCEHGFGCQCNECTNCKAIMEGSHPDVIELDAASNRGIDDIRDLISKVKYAPSLGKYKVYIIDEVHMMTTEAFNALLKTLEEPPANVVFILCTTEPYKLMSTIISRVQRYDFSKVSERDLLGNLKMVCEKEKVDVDEDALKLIVGLADGGVRDSLSLLDQAIAYSGAHLELHHVQELYGLSTLEEKVDLLTALNNSDIKYFTEKLDELIEHGTDIKRLTSELIDIVKDLLIFRTTHDYRIMKVIDDSVADTCDISRKNLTFMLDSLLEAYSQYRYVSNVNSLLEIAFLKISSFCNAEEEEEPAPKPVKKEAEPIPAPKPAPEPVVSLRSVIEEKPAPAPVASEFADIPAFTDKGTVYRLSEEDTINMMQQGNKAEKQKMIESWSKLDNYMTDSSIGKYCSYLKQCQPRIIAKNVVVLETQMPAICNKMNTAENQKGFSKLIQAITGNEYTVLCLTSQECIARVQKFSNLRQASKLPETYPVNITVTKDTAIASSTQSAAVLAD